MRLLSCALFFLVTLARAGELGREDQASAVDETLAHVATIHGAVGVFAVAGYRMGERALQDLSAYRGSFALDVTHRPPLEVQYSCIADGWQAATGVSAGKLNLHLVEVSPEKTETVIRDRKTGKALLFRLRPDFLKSI